MVPENTIPTRRVLVAAAAAMVFGLVLAPASALALVSLKQVQVSNGSQVDLLFDGKVSKSQIRTEFFNDIIQISLTETAVYPAKISSINGGNLTKIFAYQYAPKLVRCRLSVKGKAEAYKDRIEIDTKGQLLTVKVAAPAAIDSVSTQAAAPVREPAKAAAKPEGKAEPKVAANRAPVAKKAEAAAAPITDPEERSLLERVMGGAQPERKPEGKPDAKAEAKAEKAEKVEKAETKADRPEKSEKSDKADRAERAERAEARSHAKGEAADDSRPLGGAKPLPSPFRVFGKMALLFGILAALILGARKLGKNNSVVQRLTKGMGQAMGKKDKMIEVVQTHHLGPKKSISVVRIAGRVLVIGITDESINLITQLSPGAGELDSKLNMDLEELADVGFKLNDARDSQAAAAAALMGAGLGASSRSAGAAARPNAARASAAAAYSGNGNGPTGFSELLNKETVKPGVYSAAVNGSALKASQSNNPGVRAQIRSRLEGLKPL